MLKAKPGTAVTHPERTDIGTVIASDTPAWTPNDLTFDAPDGGMVKVRWPDSADPTQLYWEYVAELRAIENPATETGR